ncbi:homeobox-leucine zipper protein HOX11-like [Actinidia eriantha]|uniref:homeobox-leucine zipper protein HOX11-like n=1 Tax=Actinidia eriantha TaxID=165200 RepID=UPI0025888813|nr:homeobox-leucine zipper protein HOX11-like [Actinidia eriantha]
MRTCRREKTDRRYRRPQTALFHPYFLWICPYTQVTREEATKEILKHVIVRWREDERGGSNSSRASDHDEEENCLVRKKLRLSKEQLAFLEENFKEHSTLNLKEKQALAKQLNLHPRQVEVWFQNRRARTKLKQTEVDCEYLKKCCKTLTEENRRLQKELQELRALTTSQPFYKQLPATTLTMCPSCEWRVASAAAINITTSAATITAATDNTTLCLFKPRSL